jgi:hypothetical protein
VSAARRAKLRAILKIVAAVKAVQSIAKSASLTATATSSAEFNVLQMEKTVHRAVAAKTKEGRPNDDKASFVESFLTSIVESPNNTLKRPPSMRAQSSALGIPWSTGQRLLMNAKAKRGLLTNMDSGVDWSQRKQRKRWKKVSQDVQDKLYTGIIDHEMVIESPIANDALLKLNPVTGKKERVPKLLLQIPVCELHKNLLKPV